MARIRVVERIELFRHGLRAVLGEHEVVTEHDGGSHAFDLIILSTSDAALAFRVIAQCEASSVLVITQESEWSVLVDIIASVEVTGVVHRHSSVERLHAAI